MLTKKAFRYFLFFLMPIMMIVFNGTFIFGDPIFKGDFSFKKTVTFPFTDPGDVAWREIIQFRNETVFGEGSFRFSGRFREFAVRSQFFTPQNHLHTIRLVLKLTRRGSSLGQFNFDIDVNSDGTIPRKTFQVPAFTVLPKDKMDIQLIPVEGFLAPFNEVKLSGKFKLKR